MSEPQVEAAIARGADLDVRGAVFGGSLARCGSRAKQHHGEQQSRSNESTHFCFSHRKLANVSRSVRSDSQSGPSLRGATGFLPRLPQLFHGALKQALEPVQVHCRSEARGQDCDRRGRRSDPRGDDRERARYRHPVRAGRGAGHARGPRPRLRQRNGETDPGRRGRVLLLRSRHHQRVELRGHGRSVCEGVRANRHPPQQRGHRRGRRGRHPPPRGGVEPHSRRQPEGNVPELQARAADAAGAALRRDREHLVHRRGGRCWNGRLQGLEGGCQRSHRTRSRLPGPGTVSVPTRSCLA